MNLEAVHWQSGLVTPINPTSDLVFDMVLDGDVFQACATRSFQHLSLLCQGFTFNFRSFGVGVKSRPVFAPFCFCPFATIRIKVICIDMLCHAVSMAGASSLGTFIAH